jgi:hypothetical protein
MSTQSRILRGTLASPLARLVPVAFLAVALLAWPRPAPGQTLVVAKFTDKTGKAKLGKTVWNAVANSLKGKGATLVAFEQYLRAAKKAKIGAAKATLPASVKKLAGGMKVDGVVTGTVKGAKKKFTVSIQLIGADGNVLEKKAFNLAKADFPAETADEVADAFLKALPGAQVADATPPTPPPEDPSKGQGGGTATGGGTGGGGNDAFLPPWARNDPNAAGGGGAGAGGGGGGGTATTTTAQPEVKKEAEPKPSKKSYGAVADILVDVGVSLNKRAGLNPRHESSLFPGIYFDGHIFLGSFLDVVVVRDIGIGTSFDMSVGLKYARQGSDDGWKATQMKWKVDLDYRLAFNDVLLGPAFVFKFGYGSTTCSISSGTDTLAKSTSFMYPYVGLDIHLMLWKPYLRFHVGGGYAFLASTAADLTGTASGFTVSGGIDTVLFSMLEIGLFYELYQFMGFKVEGDADSTSDTYHTFGLKVGWNFH